MELAMNNHPLIGQVIDMARFIEMFFLC